MEMGFIRFTSKVRLSQFLSQSLVETPIAIPCRNSTDAAVIADEEKLPLYEVPTLKEYFQDLDEILSVISDGPAKSFAWRRLRYLESKWNLYVLLNEYRELADMKVDSSSLLDSQFMH